MNDESALDFHTCEREKAVRINHTIVQLKGSQSNNSPSGVGTTALLNLRGAKYLQSMNISLNRHRY